LVDQKPTPFFTEDEKMTATATPATNLAVMSPKEQFLNVYEQEFQTTLKVLHAYPKDKLDLKPAPILKTARDLASIFVTENRVCEAVLTTGVPSQPPAGAPALDTMEAIIQALETSHARVAGIVRDNPEQKLFETIKWFVAPKTMGDVPKIQFLWMMLMDSIHHRGQLTIYTRIAGGIVPSIYGPTYEEPWK
jgi:uncharacterized damage-inducible protein DinB